MCDIGVGGSAAVIENQKEIKLVDLESLASVDGVWGTVDDLNFEVRLPWRLFSDLKLAN